MFLSYLARLPLGRDGSTLLQHNGCFHEVIIILRLTSILSIAVSAQVKISQHDNKVPEAAIVWANSELLARPKAQNLP